MNELFKLIDPLFSLFLQSQRGLTQKSLELSAEILNQLRKMIQLIAQLLGSLVLLCLGVSYFIDRLLDQLDKGEFIFTPSLIFLTFFMIVCLLSILYSTNKNVWKNVLKKDSDDQETPTDKTNETSPIETAVSLFILDIVKERELKRKQEESSSSESK